MRIKRILSCEISRKISFFNVGSVSQQNQSEGGEPGTYEEPASNAGYIVIKSNYNHAYNQNVFNSWTALYMFICYSLVKII